MDLVIGGVYTIKDIFFDFVNDPYLLKNHPSGLRPHYFVMYEQKTDLYWVIPFSSNATKYEGILEHYNYLIQNTENETIQKQYENKKLGFDFIKLAGKNGVLLYMDMFPICKDFIAKTYKYGGQIVEYDSIIVSKIQDRANIVLEMFKDGFAFMPTLPNLKRIEKICLAYLSK